jgi:hypothetical protein
MSSLKFENCPFCNQSWFEIEGLEGILECYCQDCDAKYFSNDNELYRYNFPEENQVLIWSYSQSPMTEVIGLRLKSSWPQ